MSTMTTYLVTASSLNLRLSPPLADNIVGFFEPGRARGVAESSPTVLASGQHRQPPRAAGCLRSISPRKSTGLSPISRRGGNPWDADRVSE